MTVKFKLDNLYWNGKVAAYLSKKNHKGVDLHCLHEEAWTQSFHPLLHIRIRQMERNVEALQQYG